MIKMKRRGIFICLVIAVFTLLTLPSISAVELNTVVKQEKTFTNDIQEIITDHIDDEVFTKTNNTILLTVISLLLDYIAYRLIKENYTELALLILFLNLIIIVKYIV
jgi:hypothetical protein